MERSEARSGDEKQAETRRDDSPSGGRHLAFDGDGEGTRASIAAKYAWAWQPHALSAAHARVSVPSRAVLAHTDTGVRRGLLSPTANALAGGRDLALDGDGDCTRALLAAGHD